MTTPSHQTIRLGRGKHASPESGACVMELASMLAGERFSDHPRSVSRVIGAFLRGYNDMLDDDRRQDLYAYAAKVVGTAAGEEVEELRVDRLLRWAEEMRRRRRSLLRRFTGPRISRSRRRDPEAVGSYAVRVIPRLSDEIHASALAMVDELIALGPRGSVDPAAAGLLAGAQSIPRDLELTVG
jgi:hypothetical protein